MGDLFWSGGYTAHDAALAVLANCDIRQTLAQAELDAVRARLRDDQ